ncbi:TIGR00725 family protein [Natranaerofaba carboxydovora]|uniref:TIGR00725 family protein n=1 Tax=Natranaerofaba carboxydovora TaxID=2742683 RepID=UPI001F135608|nr:TIGR00725 family protein [Natranaerofaba carboxydovora]UMZ73792.1 TIGR00725: family protein [Natranaerofaba carboxydovora]
MQYIGVIGAGVSTEENNKLAYEVGKNISENNCILVCGGMGGIMEEASRGAKEAGGVVIGVLPGHDCSEGNQFLTYALTTGMGEMRNFLVVRFSDVLISISGEYGTLSEMAIALKENKKVVSINPTYNIKGLIEVSSPAEAIKEAIE